MAKKYYQIVDFTRQIFHGKTVGRILFNQQVKQHCANLSGSVLDLGGGSHPSYLQYLPKNAQYVRTDLQASENVVYVDLNKKLPFADDSFDAVLFFNVIYILEDRVGTLREIDRVLNKCGVLYLSSPFIFNEAKEPHDYVRLTSEGLQPELKKAGFSSWKVIKIGGRVTATANLLGPFFLFSIVRLSVYALV